MMNILKKVNVRAKMTDKLKKAMIADLQEVIGNLDGDLKRLDEKMTMLVGQLSKNNPGQAVVVRQQISLEKEKIMQNQESLKKRIAEIMNTPIGELVNQGTLDCVSEVKVGDNLTDVMSKSEIIVEDGVILEIR